MVGQGVLRECLEDPSVTSVLSIARAASGQKHEKLQEIVQKDLYDYSNIEGRLSGYDACFFCLGVTSSGMSEKDYSHVTYDLTMAAAKALLARNPGMTFVFVSGVGTDSSEKGPVMWARVKGRAENALLKMPFKAAYMFRPGFIQPMDGIKSKTKLYRMFYSVLGPLYPVMRKAFPNYVINTRTLGRAMIQVAKSGAPKRVLANADIGQLGG